MRAIENPITGLTPNFSIFGAEFTAWWQKLFVAAWALAIIFALFMLLRGVVGMAENKQTNHPGALKESRREAVHAGIAVAGLVGFGVLVGALLAVAG